MAPKGNHELFVIDDPRCPQVPRGYFTYQNPATGIIYAQAPEDKRKSQGRVPKLPKRWALMENANGQLFWIPEEDFNTRPTREFMIAQGLQMEIKFPGMRMTAKAPKCSTILRQEYGMKGKPEELLAQFLEFRQIDLNSHGVLANKELR